MFWAGELTCVGVTRLEAGINMSELEAYESGVTVDSNVKVTGSTERSGSRRRR